MLLSVVGGITLIIALTILNKKFQHIKRTYFLGIVLWSNWLPVISAAVFFGILASNITQGSQSPLFMGGPFTFSELVIMFLVGPLFLTRVGNILATSTLLYCFQRLVLTSGHFEANFAVFLFTAALTFIAILGDRLPWIPQDEVGLTATKLRELLLLILGVSALGVLFVSILKVYSFNRWLDATMGIDANPVVVMGILIVIFSAWLTITLGYNRHFMMPIIALPTTIALAFVTGWSSYLMVVPFAMCLALSLATADRRHLNRRTVSTKSPRRLSVTY